ncbi:MAG TPA: cell wall-active antibiotics response protein LiaF [Bacillales bacterium]|nr:cell wall-active antibiotics response protein LiaF [Bacillales bacterium]
MRLSRNRLGGFFVIFIGLCILFGVLGLGFLIGPILFAGAGVILIRRKHRWFGLICFALSLIVLFETVFHIDIGGLLVAAFFIYFGYRLITGKSWPRHHERHAGRHDRRRSRQDDMDDWEAEENEADAVDDEDWIDKEIENLNTKNQHADRENKSEETQTKTERNNDKHTEKQTESGSTVIFKTPVYRSSLIGDFRLMNSRFELDDLNLSNFIGDVKIDLSKAIIPEGESTLVISGFIGDVDIYVPYDLDVSVSSSVTIGDIDVLGHKQGGFNRQVRLETKGFPEASRKVKISVSVFIGDVDVRFL